MISLLRVRVKKVVRRLPLLGGWFERGFRRRETRYLRSLRRAELQNHRDTAKMWRARIADVLASPDNADIPRVPDAGRVVEGNVIMHNGLRVAFGTYGTDDAVHTMRVLELNGGVHEPQEEKIFQQVLPLMPRGAVMLELGAFWGFYSLWFASKVPDARCFLVEPVWANLNAGRLNFLLNHLHATFINGFVGAHFRRQPFRAPVVAVDWLVREYGLERIHILHSDIQGYECEMLEGAEKSVDEGRVDWIFISTHGNELHVRCRDWLQKRGWSIVADANLDESHSVDGLLVAHRPGLVVPPLMGISTKRRS